MNSKVAEALWPTHTPTPGNYENVSPSISRLPVMVSIISQMMGIGCTHISVMLHEFEAESSHKRSASSGSTSNAETHLFQHKPHCD